MSEAVRTSIKHYQGNNDYITYYENDRFVIEEWDGDDLQMDWDIKKPNNYWKYNESLLKLIDLCYDYNLKFKIVSLNTFPSILITERDCSNDLIITPTDNETFAVNFFCNQYDERKISFVFPDLEIEREIEYFFKMLK